MKVSKNESVFITEWDDEPLIHCRHCKMFWRAEIDDDGDVMEHCWHCRLCQAMGWSNAKDKEIKATRYNSFLDDTI